MAMQPEDIGLSPHQYDDLNRQFFTAGHAPHAFLKHRLQGALLMAEPNEHVQAAFAEGLRVGELQSVGSIEPENPSENERELFIALEAVVLFHHAAETLLRLFLAVESEAAECPWLEVTRLRQRGEYPKRLRHLRDRLTSDETQDRLAQWFYFRADRNTPPPGMDAETFSSAMTGLTQLIAECCERTSSEGNLYNSAKHGLSAVPGRAALRFGGTDGNPPLFESSGPSVTLLEVLQAGNPPRREWHQTTHWIPADRRLGLTVLVVLQIENLWTVARTRYLDERGTINLHQLPEAKLQGVLHAPFPDDGPGYRITVPSFQLPLLYDASTPESRRQAARAASRNRKRG